MQKSLDEFAIVLPEWYEAMIRSKYGEGYVDLLERLPAKVRRDGYLDIQDLSDIADWGGNQRGIKQRMKRRNTPQEVRQATAKAFQHLHEPGQAIRTIMELKSWGLTYGSKTLTFMDPTKHAMLDSWVRRTLRDLPPIYDGDQNSMARGYVAFLDIYRTLQLKVGPAKWSLADIGQGVFHFGRCGRGHNSLTQSG